jgi:ribonucleoside-diphosphate reductase alpha chain
VTVLAPTGTIAFMMDCDTTGVEPDIALVKYKKLVGGGMLKFVNTTVSRALRKLGYETREVTDILEHIDENDTIEGAPHLKSEHLAVFDCAFKPRSGVRSIEPEGHVRMMGAVQPFLSGAISKTVNMPADATVEDVARIYMDSWKLGLKAVAIYRDGCKRSQPLNTSASDAKVAVADDVRPQRRRLPADCRSIRHKFDVAGHEGYIHIGFFDDGAPGEIFIKMAKEGSTISGLMDTIATLTSMSMQYGVPLDALINKFAHVRFEPSGFTKNPEIPVAKSLTDYIFRFLGTRFGGEAGAATAAAAVAAENAVAGAAASRYAARPKLELLEGGQPRPQDLILNQSDAPTCSDCGSIMIRNGACYKCHNCGATSGCS